MCFACFIYLRTGNLRAVQLLLGHTKIESTVRYLGIEVDDALAIAEQLTSELQGQSRTGFASPRSSGACQLRTKASGEMIGRARQFGLTITPPLAIGPASRDCCESSRAGTSYKIPGGPTLKLICVARSIKKSRPVRRLNIAGRSEQQLRAAIGAAKTTASLEAPRAVIIEVVLMRGRHRGRPGPQIGETTDARCRLSDPAT